jgi:ChAPs (Chs5p-Arf1p-binding proteins)
VVFKGPSVESQEWLLLVLHAIIISFVCLTFIHHVHLLRSCFNAFSRVDVRVDVKIPGGVVPYFIDLRGERYIIVVHLRMRVSSFLLNC